MISPDTGKTVSRLACALLSAGDCMRWPAPVGSETLGAKENLAG